MKASEPIRLDHLTKRYGNVTAVDDLSLEIPPGIIFSLLGPNGAGKTTTLEMIEGLRKPDAGTIYLGGVDIVARPGVPRRTFGVQLQSTSFFDLLTVEETLAMFASFYHHPLGVGELIERLDLAEKRTCRVQGLSGGQAQRLALAVALVNDPSVVFLDEPSAGLDPQARRNLWDVITQLKAEGRTVLLTTHYMEEAEALSDDLAIMDHGHVLDRGTPAAIVRRHAPTTVIEVSSEAGVGTDIRLPALVRVDEGDGVTSLVTESLEDTLVGLVGLAKERGIPLTGLATRSSTLEDVFLTLTGRSLRE